MKKIMSQIGSTWIAAALLMPALWVVKLEAAPLARNRELVNRQATDLKIALFRGALDKMDESFRQLDGTLGQVSPDEIGSICNYFCHYQMASYYFFKATNLPYLISKGPSDSAEAVQAASPDVVKAQADAGIALIERGLRFLYRQQTLEAHDGPRAFREFSRQAALLNALKIRLYMVAGDSWYQSLSKARLSRLNHLVEEAIESPQGQGKTSELKYAGSYYEQASWTLIEARTDVPADGPEFASIRADLKVLDSELDTRLNSLKKGFLFLNIDPEAMTSIPVDDLQDYLFDLYKKVKESEAILDQLVKEYSDKLLSQEIAQVDQDRLINSKSMDLSLHKVAALEAQAGRMQATYTKALDDLAGGIDVGQTRRAMREIEFELQLKQLEYQNKTRLIQQRSEQDLLALSQASQEDRRQELRWLIDQQLAVLNLDLQIDAFNIQLQEYGRQQSNNSSEIQQIQARIEQRKMAIHSEQALIQAARLEKDRLSQQKSQVFAARLAVLDIETSSLRARIDGLATLMQYQNSLCDWRVQVVDQSIAARQEVQNCLNGAGCGAGVLSQFANAENLYKAKVQALQEQKTHAEAVLALVRQQRENVNKARVAYNATKIVSEAVLIPLEAALSATTAIPKTTVGMMGVFPVALTSIDVSSSLEVLVQAARRTQEAAMDLLRFNLEMDRLGDEIDFKLRDAEGTLVRIMSDSHIDDEAQRQALSEILGEALQQKLLTATAQLDKETIRRECERDKSQFAQQKLELEGEQKQREQSRAWETAENGLLDMDLAKQDQNIAASLANTQRLEAEIEELKIDKKKQENDQQKIDELKKLVAQSITRVEATQGEVKNLGNESTKLTGVIRDLQSEVRRKALSIRDSEIDGLSKVLNKSQEASSAVLSSLNEELQTKISLGSLKKEMNESQENLLKTIEAERAKIVAQVEKDLSFENGSKQETIHLVLASERSLSDLVAGVPHFIDTKRRALESANFAINALRGRVRAIQAASIEPDKDLATSPQSFYLRSGADFVNAMTELCQGDIASCVNGHGLFFDERIVNVVGTVIEIPTSSAVMRTLQEKGRAQFRIVPQALSAEEMKANGYLEIGLGDMKDPKGFNASLLDIRLAATCRSNSTPQLGVRHLGLGSWFFPVAALGYVSFPEVSARDSIFSVTNIEDPSAGLDLWKNSVRFPVGNDTVRVRDFDRKITQSELSADYLGMPVFGSYELVKQADPCLNGESSLMLGLIYSKTVNQ